MTRSPCGELDGERKSIDGPTDPDDVRTGRFVEDETGLGDASSFDEETDRVRAEGDTDPALSGRRKRERWDPPHELVVDPERRPARRDDADRVGGCQKFVGAGGRRLGEVLAVVENEKDAVTTHRQGCHDRGAAQRPVAGGTKCALDGWRDGRRISQRGEVDPRDDGDPPCTDQLVCEPSLARPTSPGEGQQARRSTEPAENRELALSPDEGCPRHRPQPAHEAEG